MKNLRRLLALPLLLPACPGLGWCGSSSVLYGAMIYIASSPENPLGGYLEAELQKRKLPVILSPDRFNANYVLAAYARETGDAAQPVSGPGKSHGIWEAKIVLMNLQTNGIAWSDSFKGRCSACDVSPAKAGRFFAARFAKKLQKDLFARESLSGRIDNILAP